MSDRTFVKGALQAHWIAVDTDCDGEPWPGISAEGLNSKGGPLVIWMADEGMDDVGLRDHIVAAHNATLALGCPPDELEARVRRLLKAARWSRKPTLTFSERLCSGDALDAALTDWKGKP